MSNEYNKFRGVYTMMHIFGEYVTMETQEVISVDNCFEIN